jgi:hypothetical protein
MVRVLREIIVVRYSAHMRVVFRGSWIRNDPGPRSSTKVDQYGFTMVRFNDQIARGMKPYVLPATVRQVMHVVNISYCMLQCVSLYIEVKNVLIFSQGIKMFVVKYLTWKRCSSSKTGCIQHGVWCCRRSRDQIE